LEVDARNGTVYLWGSLKTARPSVGREQLARDVSGVHGVVNSVYVGPYGPI
jgi:osmotically-inducible protein OsmY